MSVENTHATTLTGTATVVTTAETLILLSDPVTISSVNGEGTLIEGVLNITTTASATAATVRVRQGNGVTGVVVGGSNPVAVAASTTGILLPFEVLDTTSFFTGIQQYSITLQMTGAAANTTVNAATMDWVNCTSAG